MNTNLSNIKKKETTMEKNNNLNNEKKSLMKQLIKEIKKNKISNQKEFNKLKTIFARKHKCMIPKNTDLLNYVTPKERDSLKHILTMKPVRTISGVAPVAIMTKPHQCPHGKCLFCPGGLSSEFGDVPQSYTGMEPATRRAMRNNYDPFLQVMNRLEHYVIMNQNPEKVELIIMGGTFLSLNNKYINDFVMFSFKAMNDFSKLFYKNNKLNVKKFNEFFEINENRDDDGRIERIHEKLIKIKKRYISDLKSEQKKNEKSMIKCVALVIETRPDICNKKDINKMLELGCTKVELGVQSVYDKALKLSGRGHTVADSIKATQLLKDSGFKVTYHLMPGMYGVSKKEDLEGMKEVFSNPAFRPDMLKIYPCMVMKGTKLYDLYKKGKYKPLTTKQATTLISKFKENIPEYVRINRVQRDIPSNQVFKGVDKTNLRQYITKYMNDKEIKCRCIRCREIKNDEIKGKLETKIYPYEASRGEEIFISIENNDKVVGFCRIRFPYNPFKNESIDNNTLLVRELHVYGASTSLGKKGITQHKGLGKKLMSLVEKIAKENNINKIVVISGVGVRGYYRKIGYQLKENYMIKKI